MIDGINTSRQFEIAQLYNNDFIIKSAIVQDDNVEIYSLALLDMTGSMGFNTAFPSLFDTELLSDEF